MLLKSQVCPSPRLFIKWIQSWIKSEMYQPSSRLIQSNKFYLLLLEVVNNANFLCFKMFQLIFFPHIIVFWTQVIKYTNIRFFTLFILPISCLYAKTIHIIYISFLYRFLWIMFFPRSSLLIVSWQSNKEMAININPKDPLNSFID